MTICAAAGSAELDDETGRRHPTAGGLRIGKSLKERGPQEPFDERLEWDRDGQYFHYLTKWMHALCRAAFATGEASYARWAIELGETAFRQFARRLNIRRRRRCLLEDEHRSFATSCSSHGTTRRLGWLDHLPGGAGCDRENAERSRRDRTRYRSQIVVRPVSAQRLDDR